MELIVAEKPKVAQKIANAIGKNVKQKKVGQVSYYEGTADGEEFVVAPAVGHVYTLVEKKKTNNYPVFDIEWVPAYKASKGADYTKAYVNVLEKLGKKADLFISACDYDIEGSTIAYNVFRYATGIKEGMRMKFSALTDGDLLDAYNSKGEFDYNNAYAGEARHILDWYYGINLSRALMSAIRAANRYRVMSIGRVQGPALNVLSELEKKIKAFIPTPYWEIICHVKKVEFMHAKGRFTDETEAKKALDNAGETGKVAIVETKDQIIQPNPNFDLTSLQVEAHGQFRFSPSQTLELAQKLYEDSLISYPRTSSNQIPPSIKCDKLLKELSKHPEYSKIANMLLEDKKTKPLQGKKSDPAHPAIHPISSGKPQGSEGKLYDLIVRRFLASFADPAKKARTKVVVDSNGELFNANGVVTLEPGWIDIYKPYYKSDDKELPAFEKGEDVDIKDKKKTKKDTKPPKRYTQASIISELEKRQLGTKCLTSDTLVKVNSNNNIHNEKISVLFERLSKNNKIEEFDSSMITDNKNQDHCFSYDNNREIRSCFKFISKRKLNKNEKVCQITYQDGSSIRLTEDHPILIMSDKATYVRAKDLKAGMKSLCSTGLHEKEGKEIISWEDFLQKCDKKTPIYAVSNEIKKIRKERKLSQDTIGKMFDVAQADVCKFEKRGITPLYIIKKVNGKKPEFFLSRNNVKINNPFPLKLNSSLARILANMVGDGSIDKEKIKRENCYDFRYHNTNPDLINQFIFDINKVFGIQLKVKQAKLSRIKHHLPRYYVRIPALIGRILFMISKDIISKNASKLITKEFYPEYVAALFDDEGHVMKNEPKLFISNTNFDLLNDVKIMLKNLGITSMLEKKQFKLYIRGKENIQSFLEKIPFTSVKKKQKLIDNLSRFYKYGNDESTPMKEFLILAALNNAKNKELTTKQIVDKIGFNAPLIREHLIHLRKLGYIKQITRGISKYPRKKITHKLIIPIENTFYQYLGEKALSKDFITKTIKSIEQVDYKGYVFDITNNEKIPNFIISNGVVVHNSTRSSIIDTLFKRGYADGKAIEVTDLGLKVREVLHKHAPEILDEKLTRKIEDDMEKIQEGKLDKEEVIKEGKEILIQTLDRWKKQERKIGEELLDALKITIEKENLVGICDKCGKSLRIIRMKTGSQFIGCTGYPDCRNTYPLPGGALIKTTEKLCKECNNPVVQVIRKGKRSFEMCIDPKCPTKASWGKPKEKTSDKKE